MAKASYYNFEKKSQIFNDDSETANLDNSAAPGKVGWNKSMPSTDYLSYCPQIKESATTNITEYASAYNQTKEDLQKTSIESISGHSEKTAQSDWMTNRKRI